MRRLLVLLLVVLAAVAGAGVASAETTPAGKALPKGFPTELRQFVAGTDEFKQASWFTAGGCASRGGDMGAYLAAMFPAEGRLMYWQLPDEDKLAVWTKGAGSGPGADDYTAKATQAIADGVEPPADRLPTVFPAGDAGFAPPVGVFCADDMQAWGEKSSTNAWGFGWAKTADAESKARWMKLPNAGDVPNGAWADPCGTPDLPSIYCVHAYFVDCAKVKGTDDYEACLGWNQFAGELSVGTAHWIDQHESVLDKVDLGKVAQLAAVPALMFGGPAASAFASLWASGVDPLKVVEFVSGAVNPLDKLANAVHESAVSFTTAVLTEISQTATFDPLSEAFLTKYWQASALGIVLMAFMMLHTLGRVGRHGSPGQAWVAVGVWLPWAMTAQLLAPGIAALFLTGMNLLAERLAEAAGSDMSGVLAGVQGLGTMTAPAYPGSSVIGILVFGAMIVGACALWVGQQLHLMGMWISGVLCAVAFGLWVSPKYRHKGMRTMLVFGSIACSKVLVFLLLGAVFASAGEAATASGGGVLDAFNRTAYVAIAMLVAGFGVWALVKWVPFLPTQDDTQDVGAGPAATAAVIGGASAATVYLASPRRGSSGGAGQGGGSGQRGGAGQPGQNGQSGQNGSQSGPVTAAWQARNTSTVGSASTAGKTAGRVGSGAAAGVASGGIAVALQAASQIAQVGVHKTKATAEQHRTIAEDTPDERKS